MSNRTVNIKGLAYGETDAAITVTLDGVTVFSGTVPTQAHPVPSLPDPDLNSQVANLCSFAIPMDFVGNKSMSYSVTNGTVIFANHTANWIKRRNPIYTTEEFDFLTGSSITLEQRYAVYAARAVPPFSAADEALFLDPSTTNEQRKSLSAAHNCLPLIDGSADNFQNLSPDPRTNVVLNGTPVTPDRTSWPGTWWWTLQTGDTLNFDFAAASFV